MDLKLLFLTVFSCFSGVLAGTTCPVGWLAYQDSCYLFGTFDTHFSVAESFCRHNGGDLVEIDDLNESKFLKNHLREMKDRNWWIGLTDEFVEGDWRWYKSDKVANFTDWATGEPGPAANMDAEDCAFLAHTADFVWADAVCSFNCTALCEMKGLPCRQEVLVG